MPIVINKKSKTIKAIERKIGQIDTNVELVKDASDKDTNIEYNIRKGTQNHDGISLSQEIGILRKKILGTLSDEDWNDYTSFIQECIDLANNNEQ